MRIINREREWDEQPIRWEEAEPAIMTVPEYAYEYAKQIIGVRWKEAEPYIKKDPLYAYKPWMLLMTVVNGMSNLLDGKRQNLL
jgi:hypothetical protein